MCDIYMCVQLYICVCAKSLQLCLALCCPVTVACQIPLSVGFSRQEYWSELPCPPPRDPPDLGIEPSSLMSPALAGGFFTTSATWEARIYIYIYIFFLIKNFLHHLYLNI